MTATSITPLRNKDGDGKVYSRLPETEAKLAELCSLSEGEIIARCGVEEADAPEYIPSECLIYLIREYRSKSLDPGAEAIVTALLRRVLAGLPAAQSVDGTMERLLHSNYRDEVRYRFIALLANDRQQYDPKLDIFEIRFQKALAALRVCAYRKVRRKENRPTEEIEVDPETGEIAERVEKAAAMFNPREKNLLDDPAYRSRLYKAIDALPGLQRAIVTMWLEEIPIESKEPGVLNMSTALGRTPKTIASHRNMAFAALREALMNGATK
jgi:hypothetical protein